MTVQRIGLAAWGALLVLQLVWHAWLAPPVTTALAPTLLLALLPLALPWLAWRRPRRVLFWAAMAALFYFSHGIAEFWSHPDLRLLAALEIGLSLLIVLAAGWKPPRKQAAKPQ